MAFSLTQAEQERVKAAAELGIRLDPIGRADMVLVIVISAMYGVDLVAVAYLLWNRRWPPLKSKCPGIMAAGFGSCVCWFVGDLQINGHVHLAGTPLTNCKAVGVWVRVLLGVCTVSALLALRSYGLFRVFCQKRPGRGAGLYLPFVAYCVCTLACGVVAQVLSPRITVEYQPALDFCYCPKPFRAALYAYIWATWLLIAGINYRIRNIKSAFNESREMGAACAVVFAVLTFSTALQFARPDYPFARTLRLLTTGADHVGTNAVWWAIMGEPLWNARFNRAAYQEAWTARLLRDGLQSAYDVPPALSATVVLHSASDFMYAPEPLECADTYAPALVPATRTNTATTATRRSSRTYNNNADAFDIRPPPAVPAPPRTCANDPFLRPRR
ncbi:hypothetical protein H4R21_000099 [Coemansia helicoidea]|uniref:Uncharacterized protein n=2 Tax=Coemansia TaxID=4863 RepID=A0ACC1LII8_9FUNG|nr:hypothetical protein H4R21_000099 [Coemansia helicoidea]